ncbi:hypothetical protein [Serratia sp. DD3]|uniref:hypothetical protein n=1 Tax=Serratia sp. DD3 TaxID=1410619 RepID=UPI0003C51B47|nr:hypothetical protein [Serratia sp. DD3]KEY60674.1 hypothetical protein SRDD_03070 [Serratia sp. DD3]
MNRNQLWRAVACSTAAYKERDEIHVFVDAPDYETAKSRIYERLADEWEVTSGFIEFYNVWSESELREMAIGPQAPVGLPLLESGVGYDRQPLILVASSRLRAVLECALLEIQSEEARHA